VEQLIRAAGRIDLDRDFVKGECLEELTNAIRIQPDLKIKGTRQLTRTPHMLAILQIFDPRFYNYLETTRGPHDRRHGPKEIMPHEFWHPSL
tara:strand:+ start:456 stop:731 length:276 start_codon:yes stop_codon:yes gene_type:complete